MKKKSLKKSKEFVIYVKKSLLMIKNTIKSEITIIIQENIEELPIVFVIYDIKYRKIFLWYFIMDLHTIIIL